LLSGPDRPGLVASVADFIYRRGGDVVHADQHTDIEAEMFLQRVEWIPDPAEERAALAWEAQQMASHIQMDLHMRWSDEDRPFAVLASQRPHCLYDLLAR
jgi:formyltetrahydrofolate deformylase